MSFLKFWFDSDRAQREDIEDLREQQMRLALSSSGGASEKWVREIAEDVRELAATVGVLMRKLAQTNQLDIAEIRAEVEEELRPKPKKRAEAPRAPEEPGHPANCLKCNAAGMTNEMVKLGAEWMCRPCARNP
jgi:ElaB/YqjD/DUF883 family membrane-anchored ribosome-binding protein